MERKRKLPARAARVEGVSKKRKSTPEQRTQTPTPTPSVPTPPVEQSLPKSIVAGKPLPTIDVAQPQNLSSKEYQSVAESGVLADSLKRSRQTWISEGIFERYWTKVTKKKGAPEVLNNPAKDTMTKLGTCTITCEPHILDAVMYAIKEPARPVPPPIPQPQQRPPILQYGPPNGVMPPPPPPPSSHPPKPSTPILQSPNLPSTTNHPGSNPSPVNPHPQFTSGPAQNHAPGAAPQTPQQGKSTDPVIQMLAERAATDPDLKALMRIVANGEASPEELKKFQSHIDELTRIQKARQSAIQGQNPPPYQSSHPQQATPQMNGNFSSTQTPGGIPRPSPSHPPSPSPSQPQYQQPQALRSKGPVPSAKPDISGVVFEFVGGSGDRFLFPKFSILEYLPGGQVIASFLIVRKGSSSDSPTYDPKLDYYQPITIRLYAHQGRQLDALQKVVAPADEVRRYMDDIMDNMTRAEYVLLAMRLPRDTKDNGNAAAAAAADKETESSQGTSAHNQVLWATTNATSAYPKAPPVAHQDERLLTEEEKYQSFISTVS